jgi:hypothetical protein
MFKIYATNSMMLLNKNLKKIQFSSYQPIERSKSCNICTTVKTARSEPRQNSSQISFGHLQEHDIYLVGSGLQRMPLDVNEQLSCAVITDSPQIYACTRLLTSVASVSKPVLHRQPAL